MSSRRKTLVTAAGQVWKKRVLNDKLVRASLAANPLPPVSNANAADSDSDTETKYDNEIDRLYAKAVRRATNPKKETSSSSSSSTTTSTITPAASSTSTTTATPSVAIAPSKTKKPRLPTSSDIKGRRRGLQPKRFASNNPENLKEEEDIPTDHQIAKEKLAQAQATQTTQPKKKKTKSNTA